MNPFGFEFSGYQIDQVKDILGISEGRAKKLHALRLLTTTSGSGTGKRARFSGYDIEFLASARNRPLPIDRPTLVCSMGVESEHERRPQMFFDRNDFHEARWIRDCEDALGDEELIEGIRTKKYALTGFWRVSDSNAQALVDYRGIIVASYTGFVLDGGVVVAEVPEIRGQNGGRCFVVEPISGQDRDIYCHNYREPIDGPTLEFIDDNPNLSFGVIDEDPEFMQDIPF